MTTKTANEIGIGLTDRDRQLAEAEHGEAARAAYDAIRQVLGTDDVCARFRRQRKDAFSRNGTETEWEYSCHLYPEHGVELLGRGFSNQSYAEAAQQAAIESAFTLRDANAKKLASQIPASAT